MSGPRAIRRSLTTGGQPMQPGSTMPRGIRLTRTERHIMTWCATPEPAQAWIHTLRYNWERRGKTIRSFRRVVRHRSAHCLEAALAAATVLEQHGYPPLLLDLESQDCLDHVVFLFRRGGNWGTVGASRDEGLHGRRPVYSTVEALARSYYEPYVSETARITAYAVADLRELGSYDWRFATRNRWRVERFLIHLPHVSLASNDAEYARLRERYRRYIVSHDACGTPFTNGRHTWM